jgi:hypothetical protein
MVAFRTTGEAVESGRRPNLNVTIAAFLGRLLGIATRGPASCDGESWALLIVCGNCPASARPSGVLFGPGGDIAVRSKGKRAIRRPIRIRFSCFDWTSVDQAGLRLA